jgi:NNP family nitrate/nitrite transporter-like MFS transporter
VLKIWSFNAPHHRAFQLAWSSFFLAFFATFAAPPLIPVIRDNLNLTKQDLSGGAIASVTGAVFSRILIGVGECCSGCIAEVSAGVAWR